DSQGNKKDSLITYYPYGEQRLNWDIPSSILNLPSSHLYTDQIKDPETDLYYYNARYYDSRIGLFISADTAQGANRYAYANNNPVMFIDPSGHDSWWSGGGDWWPGGAGGAGGGGGISLGNYPGMSLVDLYIRSGFQWTRGTYTLPPGFPEEWYEENLPDWNGVLGTIPGTDTPYTICMNEQFLLMKYRPDLSNQIGDQIVGSAFVDSYQSAAALGGLTMAGGLHVIKKLKQQGYRRAEMARGPLKPGELLTKEGPLAEGELAMGGAGYYINEDPARGYHNVVKLDENGRVIRIWTSEQEFAKEMGYPGVEIGRERLVNHGFNRIHSLVYYEGE
ncbi:RHS repeat-associated core domain-containing protein, partial [Candidatus Gottesmanbacteria bacterium]|nr:RHS repeat-associated core domain-containing protein [Candidatus Gottesmanbacteria bacterium]